jgi:hypothetical protein
MDVRGVKEEGDFMICAKGSSVYLYSLIIAGTRKLTCVNIIVSLLAPLTMPLFFNGYRYG